MKQDTPHPHSLGGGAPLLGEGGLPPGLLEEKWAELWSRGRTSSPLLPGKEGGTQAEAEPWACRGRAQRAASRTGWAGSPLYRLQQSIYSQ